MLDAGAAGGDFEHDLPAEQRQPLAARAEQRSGTPSARPLVELGENPALLFAQEALDVAPRCAQRGADREPARIDADADRAAPAARAARAGSRSASTTAVGNSRRAAMRAADMNLRAWVTAST